MSRRVVLLLGLCVLLLTGCGLPMERGVQVPGQVSPEEYQPVKSRLIPAGPNRAAGERDVVRQFIRAQRSPEGRHAIAREFLAPEVRDAWDDTAGVQIYLSDEQQVQAPVPGSTPDVATVQVLGRAVASIGPDGSYEPGGQVLADTYRLRKDPVLGWVLTDVPPGLRLEPEEVPRSFAQRRIHYLARGAGPTGHLVPDLAFLPVTDLASALVRRLVDGPSDALRDAVDTAVPAGTQVHSVTTDAAGLVTVDLSGQVAALDPRDRERLSAQLVWTLRGVGPDFVRLRLLVDGRPLDVPGVEPREPQPRNAWPTYDPEGASDRPQTYYLADRRLRTLEGPVPTAATTDTQERTADLAAVSPRSDQLALLTDIGNGRWQVRTGPLTERLPEEPALEDTALSSPSWGNGRRGLWLLKGVDDPRVRAPQVLLLRNSRADPVPVQAPPGFGRLVALRVSRDGARVALVAGDDPASRRVYVGTVEQVDGGVRIGRVRALGRGVTEVADVVWGSATSIVVLGRVRGRALLPVQLSVDGSGPVDVARLPGLEQLTPVSLAAAAGRPLLAAAIRPEAGRAPGPDRRVLLREEGGVLVEKGPGYAPFYPG